MLVTDVCLLDYAPLRSQLQLEDLRGVGVDQPRIAM